MTTKTAQFTPGPCQCRWSGAVNFVMCPLHTAAPAMYEALQDLVTAHEVGMKGSALALRVKIARDTLAQAEGR